MAKYIDPENIDDILEELKTLATLGDVKNLIDRVFPGLIVGIIPRFSKDYASIQANWEKVCTRTNTRPAQILIMDDYFFQDGYTLVRIFCETFTKAGFCVRKRNEYTGCTVCGNAVATQNNHALLKKLGQQVPTEWSNKCSGC